MTDTSRSSRMAPEQGGGAEYSSAVDIWSLGAVELWLVGGHPTMSAKVDQEDYCKMVIRLAGETRRQVLTEKPEAPPIFTNPEDLV